jgi:hypothetical protein
MSADCIAQTLVGSAGVEPTSKRGDRVQGYSLLPLPLGQLPKLVRLSKIKERGGEQATRALVSFGEHLFSKQGGRPTAHALRRRVTNKVAMIDNWTGGDSLARTAIAWLWRP